MAHNPENHESKSLKPAGLEDKSLAPKSAETKAAGAVAEKDEAPSPDHTRLVLAHPVREGRIGNDKPLRPGDEVSVPKALARSLIQQGVARLLAD